MWSGKKFLKTTRGARTLISLTLVITSVLCGLIWTIQLTVYPQFLEVEPENFVHYHSRYVERIGYLAAPLMVAELIAAIGIMVLLQPVRSKAALLNLGSLGVIWLSTFLVQVPIHNELSEGYSIDSINDLIASNWIRTIGWTLRVALIWELSSNLRSSRIGTE